MPQNIPEDLFKAPDDLFDNTPIQQPTQNKQSIETKQPADRSWFDSVFSAPKFITDITGNVPEGSITDAIKAIPDVASGLWNNPVETIKGGLTGMAQGAASQLSPANVASMTVPYIKPIKAAAPFINAGLGAGQFAKGVTDVMGGDTASGLGNIGFGALGMGTAGLPKFKTGGGGKLANVAESVADKTSLPESTILPESVPTPAQPIQASKLPESIQGTGKPTTITVKKPTPELVKQLQKDGYTPSHITDEGYPVMKRDMSQDPINILKAKQAISEMEGPQRLEEIPPEKMTAYAETIDPKYNDRQINPEEIQSTVTPETIARLIANSASDIIEAKNNLPPDVQESTFKKLRDAQRTLLTSWDLSAPGRQGKGLITHPEYWKSFGSMFKAWGSKQAYDNIQNTIVNDPTGYFKPKFDATGVPLPSFAEKVGLDLSDTLKHKEEVFRSKWAEKVPGVGASERAYSAFLNKTRADVFKKLINQAKSEGRDPEMNLNLGKAIANSINVSTGRGSLGKLEQSTAAMKALNETFFAPKLMASRLQMFQRVLNPKTYTDITDPIVRKEALRSLLGITGTALLAGELGRLVGAQVSNDPTSSDFRKIKIGNTRIDNFSGLQQYGVAAAKFLSGKSTSSTSNKTTDLTAGKYGQQTRGSVAQNFFTNKLAPIPSLVWSWMQGREFDGTPFEIKKALLDRTVPIVIQDLYDLSKENPSLLPLGILPIMGEGMQTYGR